MEVQMECYLLPEKLRKALQDLQEKKPSSKQEKKNGG